MYKLVSISVFFAALTVGIFLIPINTPTLYENLHPSLTDNEISALMGEKVINRSNTEWRRDMKFSLDSAENMTSEILQNGETGKVVNVRKVMAGKDVNFQNVMKTCGLLIKWDAKSAEGKEMFSCYGRFASRAFLEFER